jgi:hypothetical protein
MILAEKKPLSPFDHLTRRACEFAWPSPIFSHCGPCLIRRRSDWRVAVHGHHPTSSSPAASPCWGGDGNGIEKQLSLFGKIWLFVCFFLSISQHQAGWCWLRAVKVFGGQFEWFLLDALLGKVSCLMFIIYFIFIISLVYALFWFILYNYSHVSAKILSKIVLFQYKIVLFQYFAML